MTTETFRRLALSMPEASEGSHMEHADFRVKNKIFASLWPDGDWGMVKLTPAQQLRYIKAHPGVFHPVKGGWGERGATQVRLDEVDTATLRSALLTAWRNTAPKRLVEKSDPADTA